MITYFCFGFDQNLHLFGGLKKYHARELCRCRDEHISQRSRAAVVAVAVPGESTLPVLHGAAARDEGTAGDEVWSHLRGSSDVGTCGTMVHLRDQKNDHKGNMQMDDMEIYNMDEYILWDWDWIR
jgi:hypothetical protein